MGSHGNETERRIRCGEDCAASKIARIIRKALAEGHTVDIEGFGKFTPNGEGFYFQQETKPRVFIAYVEEDFEVAEQLFRALRRGGCHPWLDKESLLPGQNWPRAIERAISVADFFIPCFSKRSVLKRGQFQTELRYALDYASKLPLDDVFVIPVRLEECVLPRQIEDSLHHVDLFPDWAAGVHKIQRTIDVEMMRRLQCPLPLAG